MQRNSAEYQLGEDNQFECKTCKIIHEEVFTLVEILSNVCNQKCIHISFVIKTVNDKSHKLHNQMPVLFDGLLELAKRMRKTFIPVDSKVFNVK